MTDRGCSTGAGLSQKLKSKRSHSRRVSDPPLEFILTGKEGAGLRSLAATVGQIWGVKITLEGFDGFKRPRSFGSGDTRGAVVSYAHLQSLEKLKPQRVIHLIRDPAETAREYLRIKGEGKTFPNWLIASTSRAIVAERQRVAEKLLSHFPPDEIYTIDFADFKHWDKYTNECVCDFLFLRFARLSVKGLSDG